MAAIIYYLVELLPEITLYVTHSSLALSYLFICNGE